MPRNTDRLGVANSRLYAAVGALLLQHQQAITQHAVAPDPQARRSALNLALYDKVSAYDRACTVLLGDPTVTPISLPPTIPPASPGVR